MGLDLNPFTGIGNFVLGLIRRGDLQAWIRLFVSIAGTAFVTFFGIFGITVPLIYKDFGPAGSLVIGLAAGCLSMSCAVLFLWRKNKLTRDIPIAVPGRVEAELNKIMVEENMVISGVKEK